MSTRPTKARLQFILFLTLAGSLLRCFGQAEENGAISKLLAEASAKGEFPGVVLIERGGQTLFTGAVGLANRQWKVENN